jgi:hypothetical protein
MTREELLAEHAAALSAYLALVPDMHLHREAARDAWFHLKDVRRALGPDAPALPVAVIGM